MFRDSAHGRFYLCIIVNKYVSGTATCMCKTTNTKRPTAGYKWTMIVSCQFHSYTKPSGTSPTIQGIAGIVTKRIKGRGRCELSVSSFVYRAQDIFISLRMVRSGSLTFHISLNVVQQFYKQRPMEYFVPAGTLSTKVITYLFVALTKKYNNPKCRKFQMSCILKQSLILGKFENVLHSHH